ncbi:YgfZ/GcvT domain-containing protein [Jannaschia aquimarina]|uniref:YgfZ protein n=1 Tax=Jannaschia aquimarina TaxID=935700 RepID=A0A0D1EJ85_9RHOB|nr:folate-binding protein YgfZ [Jannaschia aquimarina]KIT15855.1 tRNA-modifying protein YgfZ [Jannaschia aquimarina]SNT10110.1 hypothetical protein SAMN05421775_105251 [Jannaschia aquimarina]
MRRTLIHVSGSDRDKFLQGLLTRDVPETGLGYAALLTPQGKYLADFLTFRDGDVIVLDIDPEIATVTMQRLAMYKLRADVSLEASEADVARGLGDPPDAAMADPRPGMGWRLYNAGADRDVDWDRVRVENLIPETGRELIPNDSYILEIGFERLGGVDFRKGCYVGQEVTARMKHKTELRKGLARVTLDGAAPEGSDITADGRTIGRLHTVSGDRALAHLRYDRTDGEMRAGDAHVTLDAKV